MKNLRIEILFFMLLLLLFSCSQKPESKKQETQTEKQKAKTEKSYQTKIQKSINDTIKSCDVVVLPLACVNGSYAPANYQNRHYFACFTNNLLDMFGDITTPRRIPIRKLALKQNIISKTFYCKRRKDYDPNEAAAFAREINADLVVIPSLFGKDKGDYRFSVKILKSKNAKVLWERDFSGQSEPYDYFATYPLYERGAIATAEYILGKKSPSWISSPGKKKALNLLEKAKNRKQTLVLPDIISSVHLHYRALKEDPLFAPAWVSLSEAYSLLAYNIKNTNTDFSRELALRSQVALNMALRLGSNDASTHKAAFLCFLVNNRPLIKSKHKKKYTEIVKDKPFARCLVKNFPDQEAKNKALQELSQNLSDFYFLDTMLSPKQHWEFLTELYRKNHDSSFLLNSLIRLYWNWNSEKAFAWAGNHIVLSQFQFLQRYIPFLEARSGKTATRIMDKLKQTIPSQKTDEQTDSRDLSSLLQDLKRLNSPVSLHKDSIPFKSLAVCSEIINSVNEELKHDKSKALHFYDSLDITEKDEIQLWQRELLRGPLNCIAVSARKWGNSNVAKQMIPELEKLFPDDILVYISGFTNIYHITGFGPSGTYYLTKMQELNFNNLDVQYFIQDNYIKQKTHKQNVTMARYFSYIASDPGNYSVLHRAYNHLFLMEEAELAKDVLKHFCRLFPRDKWVQKENLMIKRQEENRVNTMEEIQEIYGQNLETADDFWEAAVLYRNNGYFDEALKLYIKAFEKAPGNLKLARQLGWSYRLSGQPEKFIDTLVKCAQKNRLMNPCCELYQNLGYYYLFQGYTEKARPYYIKANSFNAYHGGCMLARGYLWYVDGEPEKAKQQFNMHFYNYKGTIGPTMICKILLKQAKPEQALSLINTHMKKSEFTSVYSSHKMKAECLCRMGRWDEALKIIKNYVNLVPNCIEGRVDVAQTYLRLGREQEAVSYLESELKTLKLGVWKLQPIYRTLIEAHLQNQSPYGAIPYLHKCKFYALDNEDTLSILGLYAFETGKLEEAKKWLEYATRVAPEMTFPRATLVFLETKLGNIDQAIIQGEAGLKSCIFHDDTRLYFALASAYIQKGIKGKAKFLLNEIIRIDGKNSYWGREALRIVDKF